MLLCGVALFVFQFAEKRVGYLALTVLVDETHEELMLVTNTLKTYGVLCCPSSCSLQCPYSDMGSKNQFVVGLALSALGDIGSVEMV
jgi:AP-1 complex subunit gamma-1